MPELPEVEVLVRHLAPLLSQRLIRRATVLRPKVVRPSRPREFSRKLAGARFVGLSRRGKYLVFALRGSLGEPSWVMVGHLGLTGRMYLQPVTAPLPQHAAVVLELDGGHFVYEDARYFGRLSLDASPLARLGPEPLEDGFTAGYFAQRLARSAQPIKVRLLDQALVAGIGNIYASEALFRARISPRRAARGLTPGEVARLRRAIRQTLAEAIRFGSTVPLNWGARGPSGLFYYGAAPDAPAECAERLRVYDRAGRPCERCGATICRIVQAGRGTYYCPTCQGAGRGGSQ